VNPSEFFARLFFSARGEGLSQRQIASIHEHTRDWLARQDFLTAADATTVDVKETAEAHKARRTNTAFGEYEFAFRENSPPTRKISLSATDIGNSLKRPALVWMKTFLGVEAEELNGGSWSLATGQWVHRWLAMIGAEPRDNRFVPRPSADGVVQRVTAAADTFRDEILSTLKACGRTQEPDWWTSGWRNARHLAERFATQIGMTDGDWPRLATEWLLDSPHIIQLDHEQELRVRGRIDLILARGNPPDAEEFWIIDYKTGEAKPLKSKPSELGTQLAAGDGVQICIYALALRHAARKICASVFTRDINLEPQITLETIAAQSDIWKEIARMENTGIFGMLGELRSEFAFTGTYPLATLAIDKELLRDKWLRTHPSFSKNG